MIKAIIFDMDGVIVDTEMMYIQWGKEFYKSYGIEVKDEDLFKTVGKATRYNKQIYLDLWEEDIDFEEHRRRRIEYKKRVKNFENTDYGDLKMPYLDELLSYLKEKGYKMALASSSVMKEIDKVVDDNSIREYFEVLVTGEDFKRSKPHPDIYLYVLKKLGVSADEAVVIEDSQTGISSSKAAGIKTIARKEDRFNFSQEEADYIAADLREVKDIIKEIENKIK